MSPGCCPSLGGDWRTTIPLPVAARRARTTSRCRCRLVGHNGIMPNTYRLPGLGGAAGEPTGPNAGPCWGHQNTGPSGPMLGRARTYILSLACPPFSPLFPFFCSARTEGVLDMHSKRVALPCACTQLLKSTRSGLDVQVLRQSHWLRHTLGLSGQHVACQRRCCSIA